MEETRRSVVEFKNRHAGQDIWVIAAASSMDYVNPEFFANKLAIGVNNVYKRFPCTYVVRKESFAVGEVWDAGMPLILSEYDSGARTEKRNSIEGDVYYFDHLQNGCKDVDLSVIGSDMIVVSWSTITSAMHVAAYIGAANIIVCGHDGGILDGKAATYSGYYPDDNRDYLEWYKKWVPLMMPQSRTVRDKLQEVYGCRIYSLNPFIGFDLEGHCFDVS